MNCSHNKRYSSKEKNGWYDLGEKSRLNSSLSSSPNTFPIFPKIPPIRDLFKEANLDGQIMRGQRRKKRKVALGDSWLNVSNGTSS